MVKKYKKYMLTSDTVSLDALLENGDPLLWGGTGYDSGEALETEVFRSLCIKDIYAGLASLSDWQREVLLFIFGLGGHDKLSIQEIAWKFAKTTTQVWLTARQALCRLRDEFGRQLEGYLGIAA